MAVYTEVSMDEANVLFEQLQLGQLQSLVGCAGGIENTNYFASTDKGEFVLTLFERLTAQQLPYYLRLMKHLAVHGIPAPNPATNADGDVVHALNGKPAAVVNRLSGKSELHPQPAHCAQLGAMLAKMHVAAASFSMRQDNLRGITWWNETAPEIMPFLSTDASDLLQSELAYQNHIASSAAYAALPRGPIHADLFRDNVLFDAAPDSSKVSQLSGFFDFYFAGNDALLFDIAVCLNDWCVDLDSGDLQLPQSQALIQAYTRVRPLHPAERQLLPAMARAGALRFWISRLWDKHLPREARMLQAHDPGRFERVLRQRISKPMHLDLLHTNPVHAP
jgi:homoserine kinase type II